MQLSRKVLRLNRTFNVETQYFASPADSYPTYIPAALGIAADTGPWLRPCVV
ncbi:hypothetical protein [Mucilaginibacter sp.]|uniref:hypothetical protein n=1 Tax=Mucilaginibacter sp. TaxID=1882438 RepID=UPI003569A64C